MEHVCFLPHSFPSVIFYSCFILVCPNCRESYKYQAGVGAVEDYGTKLQACRSSCIIHVYNCLSKQSNLNVKHCKKHQNEEVEIFKVLRIWHMVARSVLPKKKKKNSPRPKKAVKY